MIYVALILNTEKSQFIQKNVDIYTNNRMGQYSKYLDTTPTFVTYYVINQAMSRADVATGQVYDIIGPNSPIRFNKIIGLPAYKIPQLQPNGNYEDGYYDTELEISDITLLPKTVIPRPDEFVLLEYTDAPPILFRVTAFRHNTIQSNDFYMFDADMFRSGQSCYEIDKQVVETYNCIFENIGTQDNCFILSSNYSKCNELLDALNTLTSMYHSMYYYQVNNSYEYIDYIYDDTTTDYPKPPYSHPCCGSINFWHHTYHGICKPHTPPPDKFANDTTYYDIYLAKFIMDSGIFFNDADNSSTSLITYEDTEPPRFDYMFNQTLWYAIMTKNTRLLNRYMYYYDRSIEKYTSTLKNMDFPNPLDNELIALGRYDDKLQPYFDRYLIDGLLDGIGDNDSNVDTSKKPNVDIVNLTNIINGKDIDGTTSHISIEEYDIKEKTNNDNNDDSDLRYVFMIIYNYVKGIYMNIDYNRLIRFFNTPSLWNYRYHLIIIYILKNTYEGFFSSNTI